MSDGQGFVFNSWPDGATTTQLCTMDYKGASITNISNNAHIDREPDVSPPFDRVVFITEQEGVTQNANIMTMSISGSGRTFVTDTEDIDELPRWSPDGQRILFQRTRLADGYVGIYVIDDDGDNLTFLVSGYCPCWSPDGSQIAYVAEDCGNRDIYIAGADGSNPVKLTDDSATEQWPDWSPEF